VKRRQIIQAESLEIDGRSSVAKSADLFRDDAVLFERVANRRRAVIAHDGVVGDEDEGEGEAKETGTLMAAVRTILIADLVMSLDNVIAVAAAAKGSNTLLIIGLAVSIPLVIFGSTLMIKLMERFPIIVVLGAALIGWVGGETITGDAVLREMITANPWLHYAAAAAGAAFVVGAGKLLQARARAAHA
jgi:predicted tellurium resistance membrane protein TerC